MKINHQLLCSLLFIQSTLHAEQWIGLEDSNPIKFGFLVGIDDGEDEQFSAYNLSFPLGDSIDILLDYSENKVNIGDLKLTGQHWKSELIYGINEDYDLMFDYQFQGSKSDLELEYITMGLARYLSDWLVSFRYYFGDLTIFTREEITNEDIPDSFVVDVEGYRFNLDWQGENLYFQAELQKQQYGQDLSPLVTRPIFSLIIKPSAQAQQAVLMENFRLISLGLQTELNDISISYSTTSSALNGREFDSVFLSWSFSLSDDLEFNLNMSKPVDEENSETTIAAGLQWIL